ncbi:MAG: transcription-repair coupling factor [Bacteroidota bacterium]|nr:transcription-repair coupling factor [Bacteroidota bacterium]
MKISDFLRIYSSDPVIQSIIEEVKQPNPIQIYLSGLKGSSVYVIASSIYSIMAKTNIFIVNDKEEASYAVSDLQQLLPEKDVFLFPTSYKKPYEFEETDNANVLLRAEVLNRLSIKDKKGEIIVTYPEALTEKVINRKTLLENTLLAKVGDKMDVSFIMELLHSYDFEHSEFVYEPGQFSIRGGIVDVFSFANELPYRIELFGDTIESIRTFDPNTQLSVSNKAVVSIIPNVQNKVVLQSTESFFDFVEKSAVIWLQKPNQITETVKFNFEKAVEIFANKKDIPQNLVGKPSELFENESSIWQKINEFHQLDFGLNNKRNLGKVYDFNIKPQPLFNKDFSKIAENLSENQSKGYTNVIATELVTQFDKLQNIFEEINPGVKVGHINISIKEGYIDENLKLVCYTDHQLFDRHFRYKNKEKYSKSKAITLKELRTLQPGDYVTHSDYGIAKFVGLERIEINGTPQEAIRLLFKDNDLMKVSILALHKISKYAGKEGEVPHMSKLGSQDWDNKKKAVKKKVKEIAIDLISLYAKRKAAPGFAYSKDSYLQAELETSFIYEDTPDQAKATDDVKKDMEKPHPMDRLVCGDVGFGKTEVAIRAAFKAVNDSKQVGVLVPTTILAMQHYKTFKERLEKLPCKVEYVNRFRSDAQIKETLKRVAEGRTDILIGTHRLLSKDIVFKNLGLLIIDEEQKFGVAAKEKLRELRVNIDTLTLTATPIPRTLHFSLMGARDLSIISTPPPNRLPVTTEVHTFNEIVIRNAVFEELKRGGQVFFVHNRISDLDMFADQIKRLVPDAKVAVGHGQMDGEDLEKVMLKFIEGESDVLVSTNIIESGLDIPNANTIIINQAHHFGLSDLHQMRGRVGRSNRKAFCYLLTPPKDALTGDAKKKLSALEEFSDLGDGFKVAMRDLDIRGAGNLLGGEQSGFITDIGFEMYHKLLDEAIQELKEGAFKDLFSEEISHKQLLPDCTIETDVAILIPENYVSNISERLSLYNDIDNLKDEVELTQFIIKITDRFGPMPEEVQHLVETVKLRWIAEKLGFDKLSLKNGTMKCQFALETNHEYFNGDTFGKILSFVQKNPKKCILKENKTKLILQIEFVKTTEQALSLLNSL